MPFILGVLIIIAVGLISGLSSLIEDIKYKRVTSITAGVTLYNNLTKIFSA